jgi:hypothetical protein
MAKEVQIELVGEAEEMGLPSMLKDLLTQNLEQNPHKIPDFNKLNIEIGLTVTDADVDILMEFQGGLLTIHPGIKGKPDLMIEADSETVMALSNVKIKWGLPYYFDKAGMEVIKAQKDGRLKMRGMIAHLPSLIRLSRLMSVH